MNDDAIIIVRRSGENALTVGVNGTSHELLRALGGLLIDLPPHLGVSDPMFLAELAVGYVNATRKSSSGTVVQQ